MLNTGVCSTTVSYSNYELRDRAFLPCCILLTLESLLLTGPVEVPFSSILFEELLHKGTFKVVHHAVVNSPAQGMMSLPVAVKRLKGDAYLTRIVWFWLVLSFTFIFAYTMSVSLNVIYAIMIILHG